MRLTHMRINHGAWAGHWAHEDQTLPIRPRLIRDSQEFSRSGMDLDQTWTVQGSSHPLNQNLPLISSHNPISLVALPFHIHCIIIAFKDCLLYSARLPERLKLWIHKSCIYTFVAALRLELGISPSRGLKLCLIATQILVTSIQILRILNVSGCRMLARHNIDTQH